MNIDRINNELSKMIQLNKLDMNKITEISNIVGDDFQVMIDDQGGFRIKCDRLNIDLTSYQFNSTKSRIL